jgi:DNA transformation protein
MSVSNEFVGFVTEQLGAMPQLKSRRMFGGVGLYAGGWFFGLIDDDTLYFKVDASNRQDYESRGSKPFCPFPDKLEFSMSYFGVPADLLEDADELCRWARKSMEVAARAASKKTKPRSKPGHSRKAAKKKRDRK